MSILDEITADAEAPRVPTNEELTAISTLAEEQKQLEFNISCKEEELAELNAQLKKVSEQLLPEAMQAVNMAEFTLADGFKVVIKPDVFVSIRKDYKPQALKWLGDHELGDIVKDTVGVVFDKGEGEKAKEMMDFCIEKGFLATRESAVHAGTLKATVKKELEKGVEFPDEFFSIFPLKKAKIEAPKAAKAKKK